jgi:hypothetical protein
VSVFVFWKVQIECSKKQPKEGTGFVAILAVLLVAFAKFIQPLFRVSAMDSQNVTLLCTVKQVLPCNLCYCLYRVDSILVHSSTGTQLPQCTLLILQTKFSSFHEGEGHNITCSMLFHVITHLTVK